MATARMLVRTEVTLDVLNEDAENPKVFPALTYGVRWNGWATPFFEMEIARQIVAAFNFKTGTRAWYDARTDAFVFLDADGEERTYGSTMVNGRRLYAIGSSAWCWSATDDSLRDGSSS